MITSSAEAQHSTSPNPYRTAGSTQHITGSSSFQSTGIITGTTFLQDLFDAKVTYEGKTDDEKFVVHAGFDLPGGCKVCSCNL